MVRYLYLFGILFEIRVGLSKRTQNSILFLTQTLYLHIRTKIPLGDPMIFLRDTQDYFPLIKDNEFSRTRVNFRKIMIFKLTCSGIFEGSMDLRVRADDEHNKNSGCVMQAL